ncbi:MAG: alanyl-tRNA synthetase [Flavobacteriaceae bacterium]|jgi:alanyl-tRNA synthetase
MKSTEIRKRFLNFFESKNHAVLESAPLIAGHSESGRNATLFTVAGMQPLMPYLLGEKHPEGTRLVSAQRCVRTVDIEEIGDNTHATMFEMLGNWSLGDYFKEEAIAWSYEFLTDVQKGLGLDPSRLYVTVFSGSDTVPRDSESVEIWKKIIPENRIYFRDGKDNWWTAGPDSPAGPSTEMFYDLTGELGDISPEEFEKADESQKVVEIWNDVFMSYKQENGVVMRELPCKNVDTGAGLERLSAVLQGKDSIFDTDVFSDTIALLYSFGITDIKNGRIIADHLRASVFLIAEGLTPSSNGAGYVLRRLVRRVAVKAQNKLTIEDFNTLISKIVEGDIDLESKKESIQYEFTKEIKIFQKTLSEGIARFENGERDAFLLFTTYGFPVELTVELAREKREEIDMEDFENKMKIHREISNSAPKGIFKGGLVDHEPKTIALHTVHHLLLSALQKVLGTEVRQRGSNITSERLRIDFNFDRKMTDEEKAKVEAMVNDWIQSGATVVQKEMSKEEAEKIGAQMEFGAKYDDTVSVYFIETKEGEVISKEFCGGPHIENTKGMGTFKIKKEESSSSGIRRIKGILL